MPAQTVIAIRHVAFEDLGSFEQRLREDGYDLHYLEAGVDEIERVRELDPDLLVVLGGPISANDEHHYPFLKDEISVLSERVLAGRPTLGICLGAQLMARAMGAEVRPAPSKEIGWAPLTLTAAGRLSCLHSLRSAPVLHWHGDMFEIPAGAVRLAATPDCPNQAFAVGTNQLALQFHPEVTTQGMERWYIGHANELDAADISVSRLRADSIDFGPGLEACGAPALGSWLAQARTGRPQHAASESV